jgi:nicotinate-nucleotide pyrophosphorylase (carboxylating)
VHPPLAAVREAVARALAEDLLPMGDITAGLLPPHAIARGAIVSRAPGVLAGRAAAAEAFHQVDPTVQLHWDLDDGATLVAGSVVVEVSGALRSVLTAERTALNFLCHLSGVATLTGRYVAAVSGPSGAAALGTGGLATRVLDTRKTTPGLRAMEKAAVRAGGGANHRGSLSEGVLIKDNHLAAISIAEAVERARARWPGRMVEVECDTAEQVKEAVAAGATMVLLDNMTPEEVSACVALADPEGAGPGRRPVALEVSGGVTLDNAPAYAAARPDFVSVGALTHSAPALDLGLDLER